jgi:hypothetical protein
MYLRGGWMGIRGWEAAWLVHRVCTGSYRIEFVQAHPPICLLPPYQPHCRRYYHDDFHTYKPQSSYLCAPLGYLHPLHPLHALHHLQALTSRMPTAMRSRFTCMSRCSPRRTGDENTLHACWLDRLDQLNTFDAFSPRRSSRLKPSSPLLVNLNPKP